MTIFPSMRILHPYALRYMSNKQGNAKDFVLQPWADGNNAPRMPFPEFHKIDFWDHVIVSFCHGSVARDPWVPPIHGCSPGLRGQQKPSERAALQTLGRTASTRWIYLMDNYLVVEIARSKVISCSDEPFAKTVHHLLYEKKRKRPLCDKCM